MLLASAASARRCSLCNRTESAFQASIFCSIERYWFKHLGVAGKCWTAWLYISHKNEIYVNKGTAPWCYLHSRCSLTINAKPLLIARGFERPPTRHANKSSYCNLTKFPPKSRISADVARQSWNSNRKTSHKFFTAQCFEFCCLFVSFWCVLGHDYERTSTCTLSKMDLSLQT